MLHGLQHILKNLLVRQLTGKAQHALEDVETAQGQFKVLTPDVYLNAERLAQHLTPEFVKQFANHFGVSDRWLHGHSESSGVASWYESPNDPVTEAQKRKAKGENPVYFWLTVTGANWLHTPPAEENPAGLTAEELTTHTGQYQLALVAKFEEDVRPHVIYRLWCPESINYSKARIIARLIATRPEENGVQQYGATVPADIMVGLHQGSVIAADAMQHRLSRWAVSDVLLLGKGIYQHEDRLIGRQFVYAGADDIKSVQLELS